MTLDPVDLAKPSWECVHFTDAAPDLAASPVTPAMIDGAAIDSKDDLMAAVAEALDFPDHFGANWDALDDCLRDLSWLEGENYALIVPGARSLWAGHPELAGGLVQSWLGAAGGWAERGVGFHLIFEL